MKRLIAIALIGLFAFTLGCGGGAAAAGDAVENADQAASSAEDDLGEAGEAAGDAMEEGEAAVDDAMGDEGVGEEGEPAAEGEGEEAIE